MFIAIEDTLIHYLPVIKPQGFTIYSVIKNHLNQHTQKAFPSIERIAALSTMSQKTVVKYLRILEGAGLIKISKRWVNKQRCFHEYYFPQPPVAYPWEQTVERNTMQLDPKHKKEEKTQKAKTVPRKEEKTMPPLEEPVIKPCTCEQMVMFPDGRIVCTNCLRTNFQPPEASQPVPVSDPETNPTGFAKRAGAYLLSHQASPFFRFQLPKRCQQFQRVIFRIFRRIRNLPRLHLIR